MEIEEYYAQAIATEASTLKRVGEWLGNRPHGTYLLDEIEALKRGELEGRCYEKITMR